MKSVVILCVFVFIPMVIAEDRAPSHFLVSTDFGDSSSAVAIIETSDGGVLSCGEWYDGSSDGMLLVKYNSDGSLAWASDSGFEGDDVGFDVIQTADGGYASSGWMENDTGTECEGLIMRYADTGAPIWARQIGGISDCDELMALVQTADGGLVATGFLYEDSLNKVMLVKFDDVGNLLWSRVAADSETLDPRDLTITSDGGLAVAGHRNNSSTGFRDSLLMKYDSSGTLLWSRLASGQTANVYSSALAPTSDGGTILTGVSELDTAGNRDIAVLKYDAAGNLTWARNVGSADWEYGNSISQTSDDGFIIAGSTYDGSSLIDGILVKLDNTGALVWARRYGGPGSDHLYSVNPTSDGGLIAGGTTRSYNPIYGTTMAVKTAADGTILDCDDVSDFAATVNVLTLTDSELPLTASSPAIPYDAFEYSINLFMPVNTTVCFDTPVCIQNGDVNNDGTLTAEDAQLAFSITLGVYTPSYEEECAADCNGNGSVTAGDAQLIFSAALGIGSCVDLMPTPTPTMTPTSTVTPTMTPTSTFTPTPTNTPTPGNNIVWVEDEMGCTGDTLFVEIMVSNETVPIDAFTLDFTFSTFMLTYVSYAPGPLTQGWLMINCDETSPGTVTVACFDFGGNVPAGSTGSLMTLRFDVSCIGCSNGWDSWLTISNLTDDIVDFDIGQAKFTYWCD